MRYASESRSVGASGASSPALLFALGVALVASTAQPAAAMLACDRVVADRHVFDLSALRGPHTVVTTQHTPPTEQNVTYTLDVCGPLKRNKDVPKGEECPNGSWACAVKLWQDAEGAHGISQVIPLAGNLENHGGGSLDHTATRLRTADSHDDSQKEGLRLVLQGGRYPLDGPAKERQKQRVVVELLCDPNREGTEGEWVPGDSTDGTGSSGDKDDAKDGDKGDAKDGDKDGDNISTREPGEKQLVRPGEDPALVFEGYDVHDADGAYGTLRLTWHTKYACENVGGAGSDHWGFFTWLVILVFMGTASYLIFGSWLNYNRYGARGWDLLPHGDTLRDVPYLMKDWVRRLINTLQGSGSRGGYSAV